MIANSSFCNEYAIVIIIYLIEIMMVTDESRASDASNRIMVLIRIMRSYDYLLYFG